MTQDAANRKQLWEFSLQFVTPTVRRYLPDPGDAVALEIGCDEGTRLSAAASLFGRVVGVDSPALIDLALSRSNLPANVDLVSRESGDLPVESSSIDCVFSLRGFTRFNGLDEVNAEIAEVSRVLKPGGIAMLWYGRVTRLPFVMNPATLLRGYSYDSNDPVPMRISQSSMRKAVRKVGLKHLALSTPLHPDTSWRLFRGGDLSYITLLKPV